VRRIVLVVARLDTNVLCRCVDVVRIRAASARYRRAMTRDPAGAGDRPLYPADHAFVIAFRRDAALVDGEFAGRVEHLASGSAACFSSLEVLLQFMRRAASAAGSCK
jgi:hypothetical protein